MKKIALFVGEVAAEYQSEVTGGIIEEVQTVSYTHLTLPTTSRV